MIPWLMEEKPDIVIYTAASLNLPPILIRAHGRGNSISGYTGIYTVHSLYIHVVMIKSASVVQNKAR